MSKTLIHNPFGAPHPLPYPLRGAVAPGGFALVEAPIAAVRAALGSGSVLRLSEVTVGASDPALLCGFRQRLTGLDGTSSPNMVLLPAGHTPGVYDWTTSFDKQVAGSAGTLVCALNFKHPEGGVRQLTRGSFSVVGTGGFSISTLAFESDGTRQVDVDNTFAGVTGGPPVMTIAHAVALKGA